MAFFDRLFKKEPAFQACPFTVLAPMEGRVIALETLPDDTFASGVLGQGCGIEPSKGIVYAPFDGKITQLTGTKHAIGLESTDGIELLVHVGMDTVAMNGKGFTLLVSKGQAVKAGTPLLQVDLDAVQAAGHPTVTAIIVTNSDDFLEINRQMDGTVNAGTPLLTLKK